MTEQILTGLPGAVPPEEARRGFQVAAVTATLTAITFVAAVLTPPLSGPFCTTGCFAYPYADVAARFPRDYYWMFPAMVLSLVFVALLVVIHRSTSAKLASFSLTGLCLGLAGALVLLVDYYVQVAVVQPSLLKGETDGIALLSQYNPHGLFIALEEVGYLLMSVALLCLAPVFWRASRLGRAISWTFIAGSALTAGSLAAMSLAHGILREYRFEVAVISIDWLVLIVAATLLSVMYGRARFRSHPR